MDTQKLQDIKKLLQYIYDDKTANAVWGDLMQRMENCHPGKTQPLFTNKDALLICYGDMLAPAADDKNSTGLARLTDFLKKWNRNAFNYVHILPFHPYSSDDGFSVIDYRSVDKRFGSWEDLEKLGQDVNLVYDFVLNHGSAQSEWFKGFLSNDEKYKDWYITKPWDYDCSEVVRPRTHPLLTLFSKTNGNIEYVWTTFSTDQVDYNFSNPDVLLEFISIFLEYYQRGAKIVRVDAIAYLWKEDGTACLHHPKTHAIVKLFRAIIDALCMDLKLLTETNVPHDQNISYFGEGDEAHMVYNFALPPLVLHAAISGDARPLCNWAQTLFPLKEGEWFLNFLAGHDGLGLTPAKGLIDDEAFKATLNEAKKRGALISYKTTQYGQIPYELNCSLSSVVAPESIGSVEQRARAFMTTEAILLALPGLPAVYLHSLIGSEAWTKGPSLLGYNRAINREKPRVDEVEKFLEEPASFRSMVYHSFQKLFEFRQQEESFSPDAGFAVLEGDDSVFAIVRGPDKSGRHVLCAQNLCGKEASFNIPPEYHFDGEHTSFTLQPWETVWIASGGTQSPRKLSLAD
ncbi:MAG: sugar phosphorylase [Treponema sp.]|jgi:sucrose phosphorylase|nr:sugar phosphorylase [Treponema sp.]